MIKIGTKMLDIIQADANTEIARQIQALCVRNLERAGSSETQRFMTALGEDRRGAGQFSLTALVFKSNEFYDHLRSLGGRYFPEFRKFR